MRWVSARCSPRSVTGKAKNPAGVGVTNGSDRNSYGPAPLHISPNFRFRARSPARVSSLTFGKKKMSLFQSPTQLALLLIVLILVCCAILQRGAQRKVSLVALA